MTPAEIAARLRVLNADAELSGQHYAAETLAQAAAYLIEYEGIVTKLDTCAAMLSVAHGAYRSCQDALESAQGRALALEAELLYLRDRRNLGDDHRGV